MVNFRTLTSENLRENPTFSPKSTPNPASLLTSVCGLAYRVFSDKRVDDGEVVGDVVLVLGRQQDVTVVQPRHQLVDVCSVLSDCSQ